MEKALEQFVAVAEAGSLIAAAERLNVSQPALSYGLKRLETQLGVRLFERSSRGVALTAYGETLYQSAVLIERLHSNALATIARQKAEIEEGLSIGTGYSTWILLLRDFVIAHAAAHPAAPINVSVNDALRCMDQLLAGDIAFFIGHRIERLRAGLEADFLPLGPTVDGYFVRRGHPLLGAPQTLGAIHAFPSAVANPANLRQRRLVSGAADAAPRLHAFACNSMDACLAFVRASDAVLIHSDALAGYFAEQGLDEIPLAPGSPRRRAMMGVYVLPERRREARVAATIAAITARAQALGLYASGEAEPAKSPG